MGRAPCCSKEGLYRGPWSTKEDMLLTNYIRTQGAGQWRSLPKRAGLLRCGKSCRLRWLNYLRPGIKRGNITPDEEDLIIRLQSLLGNRWSLIAGRLPGRTDNEIKNHWNTHLLKRLKKAGIEPKPHKCIAKRAIEPERKIKNSPTTTRAPKKQIGLDDKSEKDDAITIGKVGLPKPIRVSSGFSTSCNSVGNAGTDSVESVGSSSQLQQLEPDKEAKTKLIPSCLPWSPFHLEDASNVHDQMNPLRDEEDETLPVDCDLSSLQDGALLEKVYDEYLQLL